MPIEMTLDDEMPDEMDDLPEIEISIVDDPDGSAADAGYDQEENRAPTT
jgi:hypothetical protein